MFITRANRPDHIPRQGSGHDASLMQAEHFALIICHGCEREKSRINEKEKINEYKKN